MEPRPRIKPALTAFDRFIELVTFLLLLALWAIVLFSYAELPDRIPTHFDPSGRPDDYGSKFTLFLLPIIGTAIFAGMTGLNRVPHLFNYLRPITPENAEREYTASTRMIRVVKLIVLLIFNGIVLMTLRTIKGSSSGLGYWFLPLCLALLLLPIFMLLFRKK